jgi:hypothetical protein
MAEPLPNSLITESRFWRGGTREHPYCRFIAALTKASARNRRIDGRVRGMFDAGLMLCSKGEA